VAQRPRERFLRGAGAGGRVSLEKEIKAKENNKTQDANEIRGSRQLHGRARLDAFFNFIFNPNIHFSLLIFSSSSLTGGQDLCSYGTVTLEASWRPDPRLWLRRVLGFGGGLTPGQSPCRGLSWGRVWAMLVHGFRGRVGATRENKETSMAHTWCGFPPNKLRDCLARADHSPSSRRLPQQRDTIGKKNVGVSRKAERSLKKNEERAFCTQANQVRKTSQSTLGVLPSHMRA
jgi:hypothetical protein